MNKKIISYGVVILLLFVSVGCAAQRVQPAESYYVEHEGLADEVEKAPEAPAGGDAQGRSDGTSAYNAQDVTVERLIIRNASLDLVVPNTEAAIDEIEDMVNGMGGYVVQSNVYSQGESKSASMQVRIPAEKLDQALEQLRDLATEVQRESISGDDVTDEYVDLQSRLRHLEAVEAKLLEFLDEAEDTEAALAVYERLAQVQADMETTKGRIQYLEQSAAMATVSLNLTPDELNQPIEVERWQPIVTLRSAFEALLEAMTFLAQAIIYIVVLILPVLVAIALPIVGLIFLIRAIVRRRRARKKEA